MVSVGDYDWAGFRAQVADYESVLQRSLELDRIDFERAVLVPLSRLFSLATSMPTSDEVYEQAGGESIFPDSQSESEPPLSEEQWVGLVGEWSTRISAILGELDSYSEVFDPAVGDVVEGTISDDLADVLGDLNDGARLWDAGDTRQAMWEWSFRFSHWGEHALGAMRAIHSRLEK